MDIREQYAAFLKNALAKFHEDGMADTYAMLAFHIDTTGELDDVLTELAAAKEAGCKTGQETVRFILQRGEQN